MDVFEYAMQDLMLKSYWRQSNIQDTNYSKCLVKSTKSF